MENTNKYEVFHATDGRIMCGDFDGKSFRNPKIYKFVAEDYKRVAVVNISLDGNGLEDAFQLTNHIDRPWFVNAEVTVVEESRSTSCGDVVRNCQTNEFWICCGCGWREIKAPKTLTLKFISDPGHGYLKIANTWIDKYDVADQITAFSFKSKRFSFLEEDQDAGVMIRALSNAGHKLEIKETIVKHFNRNKYPRFSTGGK